MGEEARQGAGWSKKQQFKTGIGVIAEAPLVDWNSSAGSPRASVGCGVIEALPTWKEDLVQWLDLHIAQLRALTRSKIVWAPSNLSPFKMKHSRT